MEIGINCGHTVDGQPGSGAIGYISESVETRNVGKRLISLLKQCGHTVYDCTDDYATSTSDNLNTIVSMANTKVLFAINDEEKTKFLKHYPNAIVTEIDNKFGVPKGIGFLYKRVGIDIEPLIHGGQQEYGLRAGTENVPYIAGLSKALSLLPSEGDITALMHKRDYFIEKLMNIKNCILNGSIHDRLANNINLSFRGIEGEALLLMLDMNDIFVSVGSACNSKTLEPSYVLQSIGVGNDYIYGTIRISINNDITYEEIDRVSDIICNCVNRLRAYKYK